MPTPKAEYDPFLEPTRAIYQPGVETIETDEEERAPTSSQAQEPELRRSSRKRVPPKVLNLCITTEVDYDQEEYALITGSVIDNIGTGRPGEIEHMPADAPTNDDTVSGPDAKGWIARIGEERKSLIDHDVFDWVYPPDDAQLVPSTFLFKWKYNQDGVAFRQKTRVVVHGFQEADTGADKATPVASLESVRLLIAHAAKYGFILKQVDIKTGFLHARIPPSEKAVYVIPPKDFECIEEQAKQVWHLQTWLYGLRLAPRGWWGTLHVYLLEIGFVYSSADPCL